MKDRVLDPRHPPNTTFSPKRGYKAKVGTPHQRASTNRAASTGEFVLPTYTVLNLDDQVIDVIILHAVIDRVGCCFHEDAPDLGIRLARDGHVRVEGPTPLRLRLACFAGRGVTVPHCVTVVPLAAVVDFLYSRLRSHAQLIRGTRFSGQALGLLHLMSKLDGNLGFSGSHSGSPQQTRTARPRGSNHRRHLSTPDATHI